MRSVSACPICEGKDRDLVCEYNRFIIHDDPPSPELARYDYALCHGCGLVYAGNRPEGKEFVDLLLNFDDSMARPDAQSSNPVLSTLPLTDERRDEIRRRLKPGVLVSQDAPVKKGQWLPAMQSDRLVNAAHLEILLSLVPTDSLKRVLEVRSKTGYLLDALRRSAGSDVYAMPMFESQQFIVQEAYGIPADHRIDFDNFSIPYEGPFDLIICKHIFTHALRPGEFFAHLREKLSPGGFIYMYRESTDDDAVDKQKNMFVVMNPFHLQTFDSATYARCLRRCGFDVVYTTNVAGHHAWLARRDPEVQFEPATRRDIKRRFRYYRRWRDYSLVTLPKRIGRERTGELFGDELEAAEQRAVSEGWAVLDNGTVKLGRKHAAAAQ